MACPYYSFKDDAHFGGEYYCTKCQDYTNNDLYYAYCKNYSYDECPLYRGLVNSVEGAKRYRAGNSGSSSSSGSISNSGGTDSYSQHTYSGGSGSGGGSIPTPSIPIGGGGGWMDIFVGGLTIIAVIAVVTFLLTVFVRPFGIWYLILVSEPQILAVVATIGIMAFTVWQKWNNKILIFVEIHGVSGLFMGISCAIQGQVSTQIEGILGPWFLFTIPNFLIVWVIRYFMGKDSEISPWLKKIFTILCVAYIIGLIVGVFTPFGQETIMDVTNDFVALGTNIRYNNTQNGNSGNYSSGNNNVSSDNDVDTNNIVGDTDVNDYDNNSYDGNEYDDSGYGSYEYYNGDENNSDSADTGTGGWDNSATYQSELDMIRNEYLLSPDEEDQVSFYYDWSDGLLNDLYQDIKSNLPSSDFEILKEDEKEWIAQKESKAEAAGNNSSNYSLAYNLSATESTIERCQYLIDNYAGYYSNTITSNLP